MSILNVLIRKTPYSQHIYASSTPLAYRTKNTNKGHLCLYFKMVYAKKSLRRLEGISFTFLQAYPYCIHSCKDYSLHTNHSQKNEDYMQMYEKITIFQHTNKDTNNLCTMPYNNVHKLGIYAYRASSNVRFIS